MSLLVPATREDSYTKGAWSIQEQRRGLSRLRGRMTRQAQSPTHQPLNRISHLPSKPKKAHSTQTPRLQIESPTLYLYLVNRNNQPFPPPLSSSLPFFLSSVFSLLSLPVPFLSLPSLSIPSSTPGTPHLTPPPPFPPFPPSPTFPLHHEPTLILTPLAKFRIPLPPARPPEPHLSNTMYPWRGQQNASPSCVWKTKYGMRRSGREGNDRGRKKRE